MVGTRTALVLATLASLSFSSATPPTHQLYKRGEIAENRPYAPDLFSRAELEAAEKRSALDSKKPYAPELFARSHLDGQESDFTVRQQLQHGQIYYSSAMNGVFGCNQECSESQFCSFATGTCEDKLPLKVACNEDSACMTGYCGPKGKCAAKKDLGASCTQGLHQSCVSDYCSVSSNTCKIRQNVGGACIVSAGCQTGLSCINKQCHEYRPVVVATTVVAPAPVAAAAPKITKRDVQDQEEEAMEKRWWSPSPSGYNKPVWMHKRDNEEEPSKRWYNPWSPSPSGYNKPVWMHKRGDNEEEPSKRWYNPWSPSPSGYNKPVWMHKRGDDDVEEPSKRWYNPWSPSPSGYNKPVWMHKREVNDDASVEEPSKRYYNSKPWKPSPSGYGYPVWMHKRDVADESDAEAPTKRYYQPKPYKPSPSGYGYPVWMKRNGEDDTPTGTI